MQTQRTARLACGILAMLAAVPAMAQKPPASAKESLIVFLVRHGERADASANSELSADGERRAEQLAGVLRDAGIQQIHSSPFIRTRETAQPTATRLNLVRQTYEVDNLPELVSKLKQQGGRHLVVGHSDTTPRVVELLGGRPGRRIDEKEFDRLYCITIDADGKASTILLHYGKPFKPNPPPGN